MVLESKVTGIMVYYYYICKRKHLTHIQNSVFEGNINLTKIEMLRCELNKYVRKDTDSVILFTSRDERWLSKEFIGKEDDKTSRFL